MAPCSVLFVTDLHQEAVAAYNANFNVALAVRYGGREGEGERGRGRGERGEGRGERGEERGERERERGGEERGEGVE